MPIVFHNLTVLQRACHAAGVAIACLSASGFYLLFTLPLLAERSADITRIEQLRRLVLTDKSVAQTHAELTEELAELRERAESIRKRVPATSDEAEFLGKLAQLADDHDVRILEYRRGQVQRAKTHTQLDVGLKCTGSYAGLCAFLDQVAQLQRISSTTEISIRSENIPAMRSVDLVFKLFYDMQHNQSDREARRG